MVKGSTQFIFQLQATNSARVHRRMEEFCALPAKRLGPSQCRLGVIHEIIRALDGRITKRNADARARRAWRMALHMERKCER